MKIKVKIEQFVNEQWIDFKILSGEKQIWYEAVKEVYSFNINGSGKYRAVYVNGPITHIYCSGFYMVPTFQH